MIRRPLIRLAGELGARGYCYTPAARRGAWCRLYLGGLYIGRRRTPAELEALALAFEKLKPRAG